MKKRGNACECIHRFLSVMTPYRTVYEDDMCTVRRVGDSIIAHAYEIANGAKYKIDECIMTLW